MDIFFTLSAYLITTGLLRQQQTTGAVDVRAFYVRRALRIWPLYFAVLPIALILSAPVDWHYSFGFLTFTGNFAVAALGTTTWSLSPLWSLCVEEQFYLVWPHVVKRTNHLAAVAVGALIVALLARLASQHEGWPANAAWTVTFLRWDSIAAGVLLAVRPWKPRQAYPALLVGVTGLLVANYLLDGALWPFSYTIAAGAACLIVAAVPQLPRPAGWMAYSGRISFGLYIFHGLTLQIGLLLLPVSQGAGGYRSIACLAATYALAAASYRYLETPFLAMKAGRRHHTENAPIATSAA